MDNLLEFSVTERVNIADEKRLLKSSSPVSHLNNRGLMANRVFYKTGGDDKERVGFIMAIQNDPNIKKSHLI